MTRYFDEFVFTQIKGFSAFSIDQNCSYSGLLLQGSILHCWNE